MTLQFWNDSYMDTGLNKILGHTHRTKIAHNFKFLQMMTSNPCFGGSDHIFVFPFSLGF